MRELNSKEVANVSGAGYFSDIGERLGKAIGGAVSKDVVDAATQLGKGIGSILDFNVADAIRDMSAGIRGIVDWAKSLRASKES